MSREPAAAGAGEGAPGRQSPLASRSLSGRFPSAPQGAGPNPGPTPGARAPVPQPALGPPGQVPAVRPAPPPSAPAPSRTEPTRAGCSAGSPGWCTAAAGTARGLAGAPPPRRPPDPHRPALRFPAEGSESPRVPAAAGEGPPSPGHRHRRRRRLRPARPLCAGPRPGRRARRRQLRGGSGTVAPRRRQGGGRPGEGRGVGSLPCACRGSEQGAAGCRHYSPSSICPSHSLTLGKGGGGTAAGGREGGGGTAEERRRAAARPPASSVASSRTARRVADASAAARRITK